MASDLIRPRLVLVTSALPRANALDAMVGALRGGDVASVILDPAGWEPEPFQSAAETLIAAIQEAGAAAIVADDSRCAGRAKADGIHLTGGDLPELRETIERFSPKLIVGAGGFETRHEALEAGEAFPDYLFFGRLGGDTGEAPHEKSLAMGEWWAEIVEVPCVVMAGRTIESVRAAIATGAEFVAVSSAVFDGSASPGQRVAEINDLIDSTFEGEVA